MNRRNFLSLTAGSALAAIAPLPGAVAARQAAKGKYIWAVAMAKAQNRMSEGLLQSQLGVTAAQAQDLMARLTTRGIISPPNVLGISRAVQPLFHGSAIAPVATSTKLGTDPHKASALSNSALSKSTTHDQPDIWDSDVTHHRSMTGDTLKSEGSAQSDFAQISQSGSGSSPLADDPLPPTTSTEARSAE